uniref:Uncharacterized protein n=1 Tax=Arundo donax TaxID=35708 RepID=A0A0A8ZQQ5_ARUDO
MWRATPRMLTDMVAGSFRAGLRRGPALLCTLLLPLPAIEEHLELEKRRCQRQGLKDTRKHRRSATPSALM